MLQAVFIGPNSSDNVLGSTKYENCGLEWAAWCVWNGILSSLHSVSINVEVNLMRMIVDSVDPSITFSRFKYYLKRASTAAVRA